MDLKLEHCINAVCPWSGKPVEADSLALYRDRVVGFCNPGCRDKFEAACSLFDALIDDPQVQEARRPRASLT